MIVLGLDLATASGACFGRPDSVPRVRSMRAPVTGEDYGLFGSYYWRAFTQLLELLCAQLEPGEGILVNYEAPILPVAKWDPIAKKMVGQTNIQTTRKLQSLGVMLETACNVMAEQTGIEIDVRECNLKSLKKELGGSGSADKASMVFAARRAGIELPEGKDAEDCADSFAAWLIAVREHAPRYQPMWDRRLYSPIKGALL